MLPEFPLLSLFNDPDDCVDALQDFLLEIIKTKNDDVECKKEEKKEEKKETDEKRDSSNILKKRGHERKRSRRKNEITKHRSQSSQMILDASETLLGLVITRGSALGKCPFEFLILLFPFDMMRKNLTFFNQH